MKKYTHQDFLNKLYKCKGNEYTPLEDYKGAKVKIKFKHNICNNIFKTTPDNIYNGGCPECGYKNMKKKQRKTNQEFLSEVKHLVGDEYTFLDKYHNTATKLTVIHNKCGHKYKVTPRDFLSGRRCPNCKNIRISESNKLSHEDFMQQLNKVLEEDYEVLNRYKNSRTKLKIRHKTCGLIYEVSPHKILNGNRCPVCSFKQMGIEKRKTNAQFVEEVYDLVGNEYTILEKYKINNEKILIVHNKCGHKYKVSPDSFLRGKRCPKCNESKGEKKVSNILKKYNIKNKPQYKFDDCKYRDKLVFDFAITKNEKVVCLIEYQGIQHYKPIDFFGGKKAFKIQEIKDNIKRQYAKENKIPLIEIPYYVDNIEDHLVNNIRKQLN